MAKERLVEQLRRRSATRSAPAARAARSPSSRSPTPTPASTRGSCRSAASRTRGRPASSSPTTTCPRLLRGPDASGAPGVVWTPAADRRGRGPSQPRQLDRLRHGLLDRRSACPTTAAPACRPRTDYNAETNPGGVRCTLADYMINVLGPRPRASGARREAGRPRLRRPAARQRRRPVRARGAEEGHDHAGPVRRPEREDRRRRHRHQADTPSASTADRPALARRLPQRRDQRDQQPRRGRDHRPARPRPRRVPRRLPLVGDPRPARARARALPAQPGDLVRRRCR